MAQNLAPTKANLFALRNELKFAKSGCNLLHQKRDVLVMELMDVVSGFAEVEKRIGTSLTGALDNYENAALDMGRQGMRRAEPASSAEREVRMENYNVMGITLSHVTLDKEHAPGFAGMLGTSTSFDQTISSLEELQDVLAEHIEIVSSIWRLATEIEKTQRRINALENIFIPQSEQTIYWIKSVMEESEREDMFRMKLLKRKAG